MYKKLLSLAFLASVLALAGSASADLVVHWALEDGSGTIASDSSGNGNDGTFNGAPEWVEGKIGGGLLFRGDADSDYVVYTLPGGATVWEAGTIAIWVKADSLGQDNYSSCFTNHTPNSAGIQFDVDGGTPGNYRLNPGGQFFGPATTEWTHLALAFEDGTGTFYYNGAEATTADVSDSQRTFNEFALGINRNHSNWMAATIDELRVYDHALTADEIQTIMVSGAGRLPHARRPNPADGAQLEQTWVSLTWGPGDGAVSHDLYFGTNFDEVNDGAEGTFIGNLASTQQVVGFPGFPASEGLQPGTAYYWRVDEVNDADPNSPWKGNVWSFSVPPKIAYNPDPAEDTKFATTDVTLNWTPGFGAKLHHVYFGDNFDEVSNAAGAMPLPDATFAPGALEM
ncbi:MAG: LamG domain-containing protein, partial [Planctomycetota bacterium]|nr:LamG domain-containing protein [Planctomycetota bacterium]